MKAWLQMTAVLLVFTNGAWGSPRHHAAKAPDLFETFRELDGQFTELDAEFKDLQESVLTRESKTKRSWRQPSRKVRRTAAGIQHVSYRISAHYRRSGRKFGYKSFAKLSRDARRLRAEMTRVSLATSKASARRQTQAAKLSMVDLVLQYQALSGGYAAAHCKAKTWICGIPKPQPRKVGYPSSRVKWSCVQHANQCRGLLGPRAPQLTPEPLTAGKAGR